MSGLVDKVVEGVKNVAIDAQQTVQAGQAKIAKQDKKAKKTDGDAAVKAPLELDPKPEYMAHRIALFDKLKAEQDDIAAKSERKRITITLPDGATKIGTSWETTPMSVALEISQGLADRTIIAKVNGNLWDMTRPIEEDASLELFDFNTPEGKRVFWHSSAHMLGEATERHYGCHLCIGPPTEEGFFYEMAIDNRTVESTDYQPLETIVSSIIKEKQTFERLVISKENLLEMFKHNKYKQHIIGSKIPDGTSTTVYRCGPLIDLCVGPHIPHTGKIKAFAILKNSASYFLGDAKNDSLQRVYGISFPDKKQMTEYKHFLAEAAKRDHRKIGIAQELFFFNEQSPGSCFWLPHGARIYNTLIQFIKAEYRKRGFEEVISPNMFNSKLWKTSGHWQNYSEDMFTFDVEKEKWALKPMNCPGHCLLYKFRDRSYRELPLRLADFGVLHRNEASGALTGLTRVRRFQQDDAHIFCMPEQVKDEIRRSFDFMSFVYGVFGFTFKLALSTRPEKFLGEISTWDAAEKQLEEALTEFSATTGSKWEMNPGDGAFYGPKIDITISDALRRSFQCATIQLDFQLPQKFELEYAAGASQTVTAEKTEADVAAKEAQTVTEAKAPVARPVMIHRAILGSVERMTAILTEHFAGKWPFWLSPRQITVIPITGVFYDYAKEVHDLLHEAGFHVSLDVSPNTMKKKVLNAQQDSYNFAFIVGETEAEERSVNVRNCRNEGKQERAETVKLDEVIARLTKLQDSRSLLNEI
ncbi:Threonyl-tRNA synthetase [Taphrina deformans PYCC 5710]|uniref:Probable threonine--tRNA ligase, cytoplasmic n=1 Tax=Taphrina deformans (strain PYCC 5710 / ATCC 11124 / CBS 356.35 / IMI 108563 / JCM 9778 / NBRC 8474) TaxID=1097556 RepID=R4XAM0_TAPDE|nr:Threonyl-tRNA synthetase [Taphrina deformans PYCC 5710]|eukprot:CCG82579.1 Threonyl-tRNA synthetase [Taphrina deformans PYCC 5710]